jgi:uncharacterized protein (DUF1697 family)
MSTFINSGNVLFASTSSRAVLAKKLETACARAYGFAIPTLVIPYADMQRIARAIPSAWANDDEYKSDVLFLFPGADKKGIEKELPWKREYLETKYVPGALVYRVSRANQNKSQIAKLIAHPLYKHMTIRNVNTVRVLATKLEHDE